MKTLIIVVLTYCAIGALSCLSVRIKRVGEIDIEELEDKTSEKFTTKRKDHELHERPFKKRTKGMKWGSSKGGFKNKQTMTNNVLKLSETLLGPCGERRLNKTFTSQNCNPVTVELSMCGGFCDVNMQDVSSFSKQINTKACTFCGPTEYEEKMLYFHCNSSKGKRRRWKLEVRKIFVPKKCACLKDSCYKRNKVSSEK